LLRCQWTNLQHNKLAGLWFSISH